MGVCLVRQPKPVAECKGCLQNSPLLDSVLLQINPVDPLILYLLEIKSSVNLLFIVFLVPWCLIWPEVVDYPTDSLEDSV